MKKIITIFLVLITIFTLASCTVENNNLEKNRTIVVFGNDWHHGVIGIVSSKITEMYFKPSILLCYEGDEGKGSGRSIPGFDLHEALTKCEGSLERFGGHSMAIGLSVKKYNLEELRKKLDVIAREKQIDKIVPILKIDAQVDLKDINMQIVESLKHLEPFGEQNKVPLFVFKNLKIDSIRALSEGKHIKLTLRQDNKNLINAMGFNLGELTNDYRIGDKVDIVGILEINEFNEVQNIQFNLRDIMKSL